MQALNLSIAILSDSKN